MFTRRFRGSVLTPPSGNLTVVRCDHAPCPDLVRNQVYQVGNAPACADGSEHYQVGIFSDTTLPTDATFLFEAATTCAGTTDNEHWDSNRTVDHNLVVDNATPRTIWLGTHATRGAYNAGTQPEGYRQNERVIRTIDASTGTLSGTTVFDGDAYGGSWIKSNSVVNPNDLLFVSTYGAPHAFLCLDASIEVSPWFDTSGGGGGPSLLMKQPAKLIKVDTSAATGTEVTFGVQDVFTCACVDSITGDVWIAKHTTSETTSTLSGWVLNRYSSTLSLISSTVLTNYLTVMAFSNYGGTPIIYCEQNGTTSSTLRRFDVGTLSFLSNVTLIAMGTIHPLHHALAVDSTAGYLYRSSSFASTNTMSVYRLTDFARLGTCQGQGYGTRTRFTGPFLTSDNGKLYANGASNTGVPPNDKTNTSCWIAPFYDLIGTYPTAYQGEITSIEEDWEYQINVPYDNQGSPVIRQRLMLTSACSTFHVSTLRIGPLGASLEFHTSNPIGNLNLNTTSQNTPSITNELMTWTTRMALSGTNLTITIPSASSTTVPDITSLTLNTVPTLNYVGDFDSTWSINGFIGSVAIPGVNRNGTEIFFDRCNFGITHLKRLAWRINFSNAVTIPGGPDTMTNPWVPCQPLDPSFITSFFTGISCTAVHVNQDDKTGYFILQDTPNLINQVDLPNRVVTNTITTPTRIIPYDDGYGYFDETAQKIYFTAHEDPVQSSTLTHNTLTFNSSNVAYTIQRSGAITTFLYTIDISTGIATLVGNIGVANIGGLDFDGTTLYAISGAGGGASTLYTLNPITGAVLTTVGAVGHNEMVGIAIRKSDGQMFGWKNGASPGLYTINKLTALAVAVGGINTQISDMTFHPTTHVLYGTEASTPRIVSINTGSGALTSVVDPIFSGGTYALGWDNQGTPKLWHKYGTNPSTIYEVDVGAGDFIFEAGPLLMMADTNALTVTKGQSAPNYDGVSAGVFDTTADFGYLGTTNSSGNEKIFKYDLSTLLIVNTLVTSDARPLFAAAIDPTGGFAYFIHSDTLVGFTNPLVLKVSLISFTVSASLALTGTTATVFTANFMNGYLYAIDSLGLAFKIDPAGSMSVNATLQLPQTPAQAAYIYSFPQTVPVRGQVGLNPVDDLIYVGIDSTLASSIYKIDTNAFTVIGSLPVDSFFKGFHSIRSIGLAFDPTGYAAPNTPQGNVIEFDFSGGDPHFVSLKGEKFSFHGEPNKIYNLYSDQQIQINSQFRYWETSQLDNFTAMQEIGIKFKDLRIKIDAADQKVYVNNVYVDYDLPYLMFLDKIPEKYQWAKKNEGFGDFINGVLVNFINCEFFITFSTDNVNPIYLNLITHIVGNIDAHGVIGQTAMYKGEPRVSTGRDGEGIVEGTCKDYEVSELFADDFKFNKFRQDGSW